MRLERKPEHLKCKPDDRPYDGYADLRFAMSNHFLRTVDGSTKLFYVDTAGLFDLYLKGIPEEAQEHYTCNTCEAFINRFGGLVTIDADGKIHSALFDIDTPPFFTASIRAMKQLVEGRRIKRRFLSEEAVLGTPVTGPWNHFSVTLPEILVFKDRTKTAGQAMAAIKEDFNALMRALDRYDLDTAQKAVAFLEAGALYRSFRVLGPAKWFKELHESIRDRSGMARENLVWLAVANSPTGYTHINSSMIGPLLDDIASGMSTMAIKARFDEKMNPTQYGRSQTAPTQGAILEAEKRIADLDCADSLRRRYARMEEIPWTEWERNPVVAMPDKAESASAGVFGSVVPKEATNAGNGEFELPSTTMTWDKFRRTVLPTANELEVKVDNPSRLMALVTAAVPGSPNILQWDNPVSWYYRDGIDAEIKRRVEGAGGQHENNEIRCSLIWEDYSDLDLHCKPPRGPEIYYGHKKNGHGYLDVDMNVRADTLEPVENIRWSQGLAPEGRYKFFVHNYTNRNNKGFRVELEINGMVYHYEGRALGNKCTDRCVFEFDYLKGRPVVINARATAVNSGWGMATNDFVKVVGITSSPNLWDIKNPKPHIGNHTFFILEDCKAPVESGTGRGFFTETLVPELREIRKVLEAFTGTTPIEGEDEATACGVGYSKDSDWNLLVRVNSGGNTRLIKIDRWD